MLIKIRNKQGFVIAVLNEEEVIVEVVDHFTPGTFPPHPFRVRLFALDSVVDNCKKVVTEYIVKQGAPYEKPQSTMSY